MAAWSSRNAIGPPRGRATIEVGIAVVGATFMPDKEPDVAVAAINVPVVIVIVSKTVIPSVTIGPSVTVSEFIVVLSAVDVVGVACRCRH